MNVRPRQTEKERMLALRQAGRSSTEIGQRMGYARSTIEHVLLEHDRGHLTPERQAAGPGPLPAGHPLAALEARS